MRTPIVGGLAALILASGTAAATETSDGAKSSLPTTTIGCFGSDLALTSKHSSGGSIDIAAEVLNLADGRRAPEGVVVFFVDGKEVGPSGGVSVKPSRDPRTGQTVGLASASVAISDDLHVEHGAHTVSAKFLPTKGSNLEPSASTARNNLQISSNAIAGVSAPPAQKAKSLLLRSRADRFDALALKEAKALLDELHA